MGKKRIYYRLFVKRIPPHSYVNSAYMMEEDVYAFSRKGAENVFFNYHRNGYGDHIIYGFREIPKSEFRGQNRGGHLVPVPIRQAIENAKAYELWPSWPASVTVKFLNREGYADSINLELHGPDMESELEELWKNSHDEMGADLDSVQYVMV